VLFDGVCNLCNGAVRFIIARDAAARFQFAALTSDAARRLLGEAGVSSVPFDSIVLIEQGQVYTKSTAALRIARRLRFPWNWSYALIVLPAALRDWAYDLIARNRYRWFGKQDTCMVPTPELSGRFLK